jgi:tetratricopeptide (TPR) repeat protein
VVVVLGLVWAFWSWTSARKEAEANADFFAAPIESGSRSLAVTPNALLDVAANFPSTPAGEHALALAAEQLFTEGKYPEALKEFSEFIDTYPDSPLIPQAKVGLAACLEAEGKTSEAIAKYHEIISIYPTEMNIVAPAKLTLARLYEESNQLQQAFTYYAELARTLSQNPNDPWASEARERAQLLAAKHPELMKAMAGTTPSAPQNAPFNSDSLEAPDVKPAKAPVTRATNAAKPSTPASPATNQVPNLLVIPGVSTNSTPNPK